MLTGPDHFLHQSRGPADRPGTAVDCPEPAKGHGGGTGGAGRRPLEEASIANERQRPTGLEGRRDPRKLVSPDLRGNLDRLRAHLLRGQTGALAHDPRRTARAIRPGLRLRDCPHQCGKPEEVAAAIGVRHIKDSAGPEGLKLSGQPVLVGDLGRPGEFGRRVAALLECLDGRARRRSLVAAQRISRREQPDESKRSDDDPGPERAHRALSLLRGLGETSSVPPEARRSPQRIRVQNDGSPPYLKSIRGLPASLPRNDQRVPATSDVPPSPPRPGARARTAYEAARTGRFPRR